MQSRVSGIVKEEMEELKKIREQQQKQEQSDEVDLDTIFDGAGTQAGLEIWRLEKMVPVPIPEEEYGTFNSGDCYLVLKSNEAQDESQRSRNLHYWIGRQTSVVSRNYYFNLISIIS